MGDVPGSRPPLPARRRPPCAAARLRRLGAPLAALAALLTPAIARAADLGPTDAEMRFTTMPAAAGITAGVVALAFLINRFAPAKRRHVRRTTITCLVYILSFAVHYALRGAGLAPAAHTAREVGEVFGVLTSINLVALLLFDLGMPAIGVEVAAILGDLAVGIGYVVGVLISMRRFGVDLSGIVTTSALMTTIIAFSLQSTLANAVGGVAIQLDSSIKVGDWVQLESGRQGKVKEIRWRYTTLETRDWDTLVVPNAALLAATVSILGKREGAALQHRMWVYFNVDFRYSPTQVIRTVEEALQCEPIPCVALDPKPNCICMDLSRDGKESYAYYAVRYWLTDLARDDPTSSLIRERLYQALRRAGIPLAVPGTHLWIETDDAQHRDRRDQRERQKRVQALGSVEFLKPLHEEEIARIAEGLRYASFAPGETITRQGHVAHWLYILTRGSVEVHVRVDAEDTVLATIDAPGFFGEMGLMTGEPRTATVVAVGEVECYRLDKATFHQILTERPEMAAEMSALLATRKVGLIAAREGLDVAAKQRRVEAEGKRILSTIQRFFGLASDGERVA